MGDTYEWHGGSGAFGTASNWDNYTTSQDPSPTAPGPSDFAGLEADSSATVSGDGDVGSMQIGDNIIITGALTAENSISVAFAAGGVTLTGSLTAKSAFNVTDDSTLDVNHGGAVETLSFLDFGAIVVDDGSIDSTDGIAIGGTLLLTNGQITAAGPLGVGGNPGLPTTLDIGSGGTVSDHSASIGMIAGDESSVAVHDGGVWQTSTNVVIGLGTIGTLDITAGGHVTMNETGQNPMLFGFGAGGGAVITVDGGGSVLDVTGDADFGFVGGTGTLSLDGGGSVDVSGTLTAGTADIDVNASTLTIGQGLTMTEVASTLEIEGGAVVNGPSSPGSMTVEGSIDVNDGTLTGSYLAAGGTITVQDGTIQSNNILLGGGTGGVLQTTTLGSGALMNAAIGELGPESGDKAIVYIQADATLQTSYQLMVGAGGSGGLDIEGGLANIEGGVGEGNAALDVGELSAGALGTIAMDGAGSSLTVTGAAVLGDAGNGSLLLGTNASFTVSFGLYEGAQATGGGNLQVVDKTDTFSVGGDWVIGDAGGHVDLIEGGASANVGGALTIARNGGIGSLTVTDTGSVVNVARDITVGMRGHGTLQVEAGASLASTGGGFFVTTGSVDIGGGAAVSANSATIGAAGTLGLAGGTLSADDVTVSGTVTGNGTIAAALTDDGDITASDGTLLVQGLVDGTGVLDVSGGTLELQTGIAAGPTIVFAGGAVVLDTPGAAGATFADFSNGDTIVLNGVIADSGTFAGGTLLLEDGGAPQAVLSFVGSYASNDFIVTTLGNETEVIAAPCYAAGTRIATERGPVAVEALRVGDRVVSAFGGTAPVVWLGHRRIDCRRHPRPQDVRPVRIRAGAFGRGRPAADLRLSPDHAVFAAGVLIPVRYLINGATIVQEPEAAVTYWHVELPAHGVMLAEGLPCESYLDTGNRAAFANGEPAVQLHPDFALAVWQGRGCAKLVRDGAALHAVRRRLLAQAERLGYALTGDPALHLDADGETLWPVAIEGRRHRFALRRLVATLRLRSRCGVPAEVGAADRDHRRLGVMVERITAYRPWQWHDIPLAAIPDGGGFHPLEAAGRRRWRWTDGDAHLPLPRACADGVLLLDVHVGAAQTTWRAAALAHAYGT